MQFAARAVDVEASLQARGCFVVGDLEVRRTARPLACVWKEDVPDRALTPSALMMGKRGIQVVSKPVAQMMASTECSVPVWSRKPLAVMRLTGSLFRAKSKSQLIIPDTVGSATLTCKLWYSPRPMPQGTPAQA